MQTSMSLSATLLKFRAVGQKQANNSKNMRQKYETNVRVNKVGLTARPTTIHFSTIWYVSRYSCHDTIHNTWHKNKTCRGLRNKPSWRHAGVSLHSYWLPNTGLSLRAITHNSWAQWMLQALQLSCTFSSFANYYVCTITSYDWLKT